MKSVWWRVALFMALFLILDDKLPAHMTIAGIRPDLALAGLFLVTLREGAAVGAWAGFASGLFIDVATPEGLGARALSLAVSGFLIGRTSEHVDLGSHVVLLILLLFMGIADAVIYEFALHLTSPGTALSAIVTRHAPDLVYTGIVTLILLMAFGRRFLAASGARRY
jgi:rod shape-determining protein MreD